ncbi:MAG TPA: ABC transporter substrate-binding protein, partial [Clostridiales bacterium]|nr:ABC transporter substrate-binding protein [Clostridiales bacterium]
MLLVVASLTACGNDDDTDTNKEADTTDEAKEGDEDKTESADEIYFLNFKPEIAEVYDKVAADYEEETGVKVKVVTAASGTYEQTLKSEIAKSDPPTIFQINGPVGYQSWKDYTLDLKSTDLYSYLSDPGLAVT